MPFSNKLPKGTPTLSYEFFPPKTPEGWGLLYNSLEDAKRESLDFISVTYGAGGSTREKTLELTGRTQNELGLDTMSHLTCVGHSKEELHLILQSLSEQNIPAIMALRGDPPQGQSNFTIHPDGFAHATDLIAYIKQNFCFVIGAACYPEGHTESPNVTQDIAYLKLKQDKGADFAVTQLFFDNSAFYHFRDNAQKAGVQIPIIAGIMPVKSLQQLDRFRSLSGCSFPNNLIEGLQNRNEAEQAEFGIEFGIQQCADLLDNGIAGIHLYTLNRSEASARIISGLRDLGYFR
jgi:methylenetetrahydrofolate reductase (NADPH)